MGASGVVGGAQSGAGAALSSQGQAGSEAAVAVGFGAGLAVGIGGMVQSTSAPVSEVALLPLVFRVDVGCCWCYICDLRRKMVEGFNFVYGFGDSVFLPPCRRAMV